MFGTTELHHWAYFRILEVEARNEAAVATLYMRPSLLRVT